MATEMHCTICGKPVASMRASFESRMDKLRKHRKKMHPAAFKKSVRKAVRSRKR